MGTVLRFAGFVGALYVFACVALYLAQRSLIYFPQARDATAGAPVITLAVDGAQLEVTVRPMPGRHAVLYFGGNAEDVTRSLPLLAPAYPQHALYLMHYRGYGGSTGKPSEKALFADALALYDRVRTEHPDITLVGRSLGSGVATHVASRRPVQALVLVTPYDSIVAIAARQFPVFPVDYLLSDKFETWRDAPNVTAPTTIIVAEHDEVIPRASSERLLTRFKPGVARRVMVAGAGHNSISDDPAYRVALTQIDSDPP